MSRIDQTFRMLKDRSQIAFIPFVMAGDPDLDITEALIYEMADNGADLIELGVPYSNPFADGPTIQASSQRALQNGINLREIFLLTQRLKGITLPLVLMTYFNPILQYGLRDFAESCKQSKIDGVLVSDLPSEEAGPWIQEARKYDLDTPFLLFPKSSIEKIKIVVELSRGFVYYASVRGLTGVREKLPKGLEYSVRQVKRYCQKPVVVGFGISSPEHVEEVSHFVDGVVVGSAIVKIIEENLKNSIIINKVGNFVYSLTHALKS